DPPPYYIHSTRSHLVLLPAGRGLLQYAPGLAVQDQGCRGCGPHYLRDLLPFHQLSFHGSRGNVKDRVNDIKRLNAMLNVPKFLPIRKRGSNLTDNFDVVFWCGDLNFRLEEPRETVIQKLKDGEPVLSTDQLNHLRLESRAIFRGFEESPISFFPTYKYDLGTNDFDSSSKQRTPAYTDRILYKATNTSILPLFYDSVQDVCTSDHKPVWGMWKVKLRPGKDSIPLAGGLFNREVYLEGLKRRSEALQP
ncbi:72 kDa inositol polyphosphate 5phosphataselike, partial [Caligus rogercresseyi]